MPTNEYTKALEQLAKAKTRLADAEEKFYPALLDALCPPTKPPAQKTDQPTSNRTPPKLPKK